MAYKPAYIWNGTGWDQIGNQAVASLDDYALLNPSASANQTITNTTLTSPNINDSSIIGGTADSVYLISPSEKMTVSASAATGTVNFDVIAQAILYYTSNATGNWTLNFRGDGSTTLDSIMAVGESVTASFLATQGSTAYYPSAFQIDGSSITPKWSGGTAPTSGNSNSIDAYSFTIVKTGSATFTAFGGAVQFA
jgi:hypothetical protein